MRSESRHDGGGGGGGGGDVPSRAEFMAMKPKALQKFLRARDIDYEESDRLEKLVDLACRGAHRPLVLWQKMRTGDGRCYWFNVRDKSTTWQQPQQQYVS